MATHSIASRSADSQTLAAIGLIAATLFGSAGQLRIPEFWVYLGIIITASTIGICVLDPDLLRERARPGGHRLSAKYWLVILLPLAHWGIAGVDRGRLHWSDTVPPQLETLALVLFAAAWAAIIWAMDVNRFFSSVARIQQDRGHHVVASGPYRWLRHPGYAAALVAMVSSGVALGSWAAVLLGVLAVPLLLWRTVAEDRLLRAQLPGYDTYVQQVRYRLVPGLW